MTIRDQYGQIYNGGEIELVNPNGLHLSSVHPTKKARKVYYELTHISGGFRFMSGFSFNKSYLYFNKGSSHTSFAYGRLHFSDYNDFVDLHFSPIDNSPTIGIGIDIDRYELYYRFNDEIIIVPFAKHDGAKDISLYIVESNEAFAVSDIIKINSGNYPFFYSPPFGYCPWNNPSCTLSSCNYEQVNKVNCIIIIMSLIQLLIQSII